jgi:hypothetical protein
MYEGIVWAAVSSSPQVKNVSLDAQLTSALQYADRYHTHIKGALVVPGESRYITLFHRAAEKVRGLKLNTEGIQLALRIGMQALVEQAAKGEVVGVEHVFVYAEFLELAESNSFNVLFFLNRSRLGRRAALSITLADICTENGIKLFDMESPPSSLDVITSHDEQLLGVVKSVGFERDVRKLIDDTQRGVFRRVERGLFGRRITWGYRAIHNEAGKLTGYAMDEDVKITMQIFARMYLDGYGLLPICQELNRLGRKPPRGDAWIETKLQGLMDRLWLYAGFAEVNRLSKQGRPYFRARGIWEPMLDEETVRRMLKERDERNHISKSISNRKKYSRLVICDHCGRTMRVHAGMWKPGKTHPNSVEYYRELYKCEEHGAIISKKIDAALEAYFVDLEDANFRAMLADRQAPDQSAGIIERIESLQADIDRRKAGIARADQDYYLGSTMSQLDEERHRTIVGAAKKQIETLQAEITKLQDNLHAIEQDSKRGERVEQVWLSYRDRFYDADINRANAWLRENFRVYVYDHQVKAIVIL